MRTTKRSDAVVFMSTCLLNLIAVVSSIAFTTIARCLKDVFNY
jgi:hypothetical protein